MNRIVTTAVFLAAFITAPAARAQDATPSHDQTGSQTTHSDRFWYARLGYGGVFGDDFTGGPALGFGFRAAFDSFGLDVSFLNYKAPASSSVPAYDSSASMASSLLKLEGLYFTKPKANATAYLGGGLSYGTTLVEGGFQTGVGRGLQGELTVGYEWLRASPLRVFVQADTTLPFYNITSGTFYSPYSPSRPTITTGERYAPSLVVAIGLGF
jgi:hypothetical protein